MARAPKPSGCKQGREIHRRRYRQRDLRKRFLIVCEGSKTEPNYFRSFRANAQVVGKGYNTLSLVKSAVEMIQEDEYDEVWCVFDRDSFPMEQFNNAILKAKKEGIQVAYSNEAFEIWYLLHFNYYDTGMSRTQYKDKLTELLGSTYQKNDRGMYDILESKQPTAIRNAETLLRSYGDEHDPEQDNPCTTVHLLVQRLNEQIR
ncbi:MAG TPA: RloB domain-containing protein [Thermoflexia bacterium]|nr:RloB domain-containing protein [Thermoflexia bacterium]